MPFTRAEKVYLSRVVPSVQTVNTYSEMLVLCTGNVYRQFYVLSDETNDGEATRYDWTGTEIKWIITQTI